MVSRLDNNEYTNFDYNFDQLIKPIDLNLSKQDLIMDSNSFNKSLKSIENNLNILHHTDKFHKKLL